MYLDAKSLTMDETEFEEHMQATRLASVNSKMGPSLRLNETTLPAWPTGVSQKEKHTELSPSLGEMVALAWSEQRGMQMSLSISIFYK